MLHPLHRVIGDTILEAQLPGWTVLRDTACGGDQHLPLFSSEVKSYATQYCNVDVLILGKDASDPEHEKVRVIVEIEEANVKPVQVFGKFFSCAMSPYFVHERKQCSNPNGGLGSIRADP